MYPGMIITYKVAPILNIKIDWMTEITHVRDKEFLLMNKEWEHIKLIIYVFLKSKIMSVDENVITYIPLLV